MSTEALQKAVEIAGGQTALAKRLGVSQGMVWQMLNGRRQIPDGMAIRLYRAVGGQIEPHRFRPDLYEPGYAPPVQPDASAA